MDFYEALNKRRSIRGYKPDAVPEDAIRRIGEAVRTAPTACNRQPCQILLVRNPEKRAALAKVYPQNWLAQAPIIAVLVGCESEAWKRLEGNTIIDVDAAIAMEHFMLAATAEGLGTCWICAFRRAEADKALGLDPKYKTVAMSPLGYAAAEPGPFVRKPLDELFKVVD